MILNYESEVRHITKDFDKKMIKKYSVDSLVSLNNKLIDMENHDIEKSMLELKSFLRNIADGEPKQRRIYRKEFESLKKSVIEKYGFYQKGSVIENSIGLGLVFGVAIGASLTSLLVSSAGIGLALGMAIGSAIGTRKEKELEAADKLYWKTLWI